MQIYAFYSDFRLWTRHNFALGALSLPKVRASNVKIVE